MDKYILITAARNEEAFIEKTIKSVIAQSILPLKWFIVSDGSTDQTENIVEFYSGKHSFIKFIKVSGEKTRKFSSKAKAVMLAYKNTENLDFQYIGILDADILFDPTYYENIIRKFQLYPNLGIAGGVRFDYNDGEFKKVQCADNSVGGPFQMFRKNCFEQVGGYLSLKYGGIDAAAEIHARKLGWKVQSFPEYHLYHQRFTGTAEGKLLKYRIQEGFQFHSLGYHPLFITLKYLKEILNKPIIIGSLVSLAAFYYATICRFKKQLSRGLIDYLRQEQIDRMKTFFKRKNDSSKKMHVVRKFKN